MVPNPIRLGLPYNMDIFGSKKRQTHRENSTLRRRQLLGDTPVFKETQKLHTRTHTWGMRNMGYYLSLRTPSVTINACWVICLVCPSTRPTRAHEGNLKVFTVLISMMIQWVETKWVHLVEYQLSLKLVLARELNDLLAFQNDGGCKSPFLLHWQ